MQYIFHYFDFPIFNSASLNTLCLGQILHFLHTCCGSGNH